MGLDHGDAPREDVPLGRWLYWNAGGAPPAFTLRKP